MTGEAHPPVISVMLAVPDAAAATRWYAQALGATDLWNLGGVVGLTIAGAPFFLGQPENNGWDTPAALGSRTVRVEVFVDDPDGFIDRAVAARLLSIHAAVSSRYGPVGPPSAGVSGSGPGGARPDVSGGFVRPAAGRDCAGRLPDSGQPGPGGGPRPFRAVPSPR
jgi:catechol 2,3-dioxygenase-like lactoylglutathione lyase family enzyme